MCAPPSSATGVCLPPGEKHNTAPLSRGAASDVVLSCDVT